MIDTVVHKQVDAVRIADSAANPVCYADASLLILCDICFEMTYVLK